MSSQLQKYVPLKTIVSYFLDANNKSMGDFDRAWVIAFRGYADLGFDIMFEPKTLRLPVNGNLTVTLPPDYIKWTKIGIMNSSGELSTLKVNSSLTKLKDLNPNRLAKLNPDTPDFDVSNLVLNPYFLNYYFGNWYTPIFGLGNGLVQYGECVVDEANGVIVLSPSYPFGDLMLEYISSPQEDEDYQVETICQEAIIAFIEWKMKVGSEQDYYNRKIEARRRLKPIQLQKMNQVVREYEGFKLKS